MEYFLNDYVLGKDQQQFIYYILLKKIKKVYDKLIAGRHDKKWFIF